MVWRVQDSNLGSFRDGFTVRSHWPLGQPAKSRTYEPDRDRSREATRPTIADAGGCFATPYPPGRHLPKPG